MRSSAFDPTRHDDAHLLTVLADWVAGGGVIPATQHEFQVRGWVRVDRYGSLVLTHAGMEAVRGIGHEA